MTTTVIVKARAHGAIVTVAEKAPGEEGHVITSADYVVGGNQERRFDIADNQSVTVEQGPAPVPTTDEEAEEQHAPNPRPFVGEPVPGAAENDALLGNANGDDTGSTFQA